MSMSSFRESCDVSFHEKMRGMLVTIHLFTCPEHVREISSGDYADGTHWVQRGTTIRFPANGMAQSMLNAGFADFGVGLLGGHVTASGEFAFHSADQGFHVGGFYKIVVNFVVNRFHCGFKSRIASEQDSDAFWIRDTHSVHDGESIPFFADVEIGK